MVAPTVRNGYAQNHRAKYLLDIGKNRLRLLADTSIRRPNSH
jgi:hypothetical protein